MSNANNNFLPNINNFGNSVQWPMDGYDCNLLKIGTSADFALDLANKSFTTSLASTFFNPSFLINPTLLNPSWYPNSTSLNSHGIVNSNEQFLPNTSNVPSDNKLEVENIVNALNMEHDKLNGNNKTDWNESFLTQKPQFMQENKSFNTMNLFFNLQQQLMINHLIKTWHDQQTMNKNYTQDQDSNTNQINPMILPLSTTVPSLSDLTFLMPKTMQPDCLTLNNHPNLCHSKVSEQNNLINSTIICNSNQDSNGSIQASLTEPIGKNKFNCDKQIIHKETYAINEHHHLRKRKLLDLEDGFKKNHKQSGSNFVNQVVSSIKKIDNVSVGHSANTKEEQWKRHQCSGCGHRSNWKWDINKHIKVSALF